MFQDEHIAQTVPQILDVGSWIQALSWSSIDDNTTVSTRASQIWEKIC